MQKRPIAFTFPPHKRVARHYRQPEQGRDVQMTAEQEVGKLSTFKQRQDAVRLRKHSTIGEEVFVSIRPPQSPGIPGDDDHLHVPRVAAIQPKLMTSGDGEQQFRRIESVDCADLPVEVVPNLSADVRPQAVSD